MDSPLEDIQINFNEDSLFVLNLAIAFIMFGVSLSLKKDHFKMVLTHPKSVFAGVVSQFILLPAFTFLFVLIVDPLPGLALGMILVASCPGGSVSNFFSMVSGGNVALSVSLTAVATVLATIMTPINFEFWSGLLPASFNSQPIAISFWDMMKTIFTILGAPLVLGLWFSSRFPKLTANISKPVRILSFLILVGFIAMALAANFELFKEYAKYIVILVFFHNALALLLGYFFTRSVGCSAQDARSIAIETGIQNSGIGLVIIFSLFDGNGGMALITAWWGIWHIIAGFIISFLFNYKRILRLRFTS